MHGFDYMEENTQHGWNSTFAAASLARINASRLRVARTWYGPDWTMSTWGAPLNFTTPKFEQFCVWVADMKSVGVKVALQAGWWSPANTCTIGSLSPVLFHSYFSRFASQKMPSLCCAPFAYEGLISSHLIDLIARQALLAMGAYPIPQSICLSTQSGWQRRSTN